SELVEWEEKVANTKLAIPSFDKDSVSSQSKPIKLPEQTRGNYAAIENAVRQFNQIGAGNLPGKIILSATVPPAKVQCFPEVIVTGNLWLLSRPETGEQSQPGNGFLPSWPPVVPVAANRLQ